MLAFGQRRWGRPSLKVVAHKTAKLLGGKAGLGRHQGEQCGQPQALYTSCFQPGERRPNKCATRSTGQLPESQPLDTLVGSVQTSVNEQHPSWTQTEATGIEITRLNLGNELSLGKKHFSLAFPHYTMLFQKHPNFCKCPASKEMQGENSVCLGNSKKKAMGRKARDVLLDAELQSWRNVSFPLNKFWSTVFCCEVWHSNKPLPKPYTYIGREKQRRHFTPFFQTVI